MKTDLTPVGLDLGGGSFTPYFCTPENYEFFASLGVDGVHFVLLPNDERVFLVDPAFGEISAYVQPVAENMRRFLSFLLSCRDANVISQIWWMSEDQYRELLREDAKNRVPGKEEALNAIQREFSLEPTDPFAPVKTLCRDFDASILRFSHEYYDVLGLERE